MLSWVQSLQLLHSSSAKLVLISQIAAKSRKSGKRNAGAERFQHGSEAAHLDNNNHLREWAILPAPKDHRKRGKIMFEMGLVVITNGINDKLDNVRFNKELKVALHRFTCGDWGEMEQEDIEANNEALRNGERLFAAYKTSEGKIWIITEADRSATTILFPDEY